MRKLWIALGGFALGVMVTAWFGPGRDVPLRIEPGAAERELDRPVARIDLQEVPFDQAIDALRQFSRMPIQVDDAGVALARFDRSTPVTLHGRGVALGEILRRLLRTPQGPWLDYMVVNGRIVITAPSTVENHVYVRAYDVRTLLSSEPFLVAQPVPAVLGAGAPPSGPARELLFYLAQGTDEGSRPQTWTGCVGDRLIVCQTWEGHRQIRGLLGRFNAPTISAPRLEGPRPHWDQVTRSWVEAADDARIEAALRRPIARIRFDQTRFDDAVRSLSVLAGVPIIVDVDSRGEIWPPSDRVTLDLHDVPLWRVLSQLARTRPNGWPVAWWPEDGVIVVSPQHGELAHQVSRVYEVGDLVGPGGNAGALIRAAIPPTADEPNYPRPWAGIVPGRSDRLVVVGSWATQERFASVLAALRNRSRAPDPLHREPGP